MPARAPRLPFRAWPGCARGALMTLCLWLAVSGIALARQACTAGDGIWLERACFATRPDTAFRYGHSVLGDTSEWHILRLEWTARGQADLGLPDAVIRIGVEEAIYEDIAPRIVELDDDPYPEILVVQSAFNTGARVLVLDPQAGSLGTRAGPWIGQTHRWLAPVGVADLDGDGRVEIAYVDRPHLARILRVFAMTDGGMIELATAPGLTNHRIGQDFITGGIRDCGAGPEMITADTAWRQVMATRLEAGRLVSRALGAFSPDAVALALACR